MFGTRSIICGLPILLFFAKDFMSLIIIYMLITYYLVIIYILRFWLKIKLEIEQEILYLLSNF